MIRYLTRRAVGWLVMQDLFAVAVLVLLPSIAPIITGHPNGDTLAPWPLGELGPLGELTWALLLAGVFALLMVVVGRRLVPWLLELVAREQSRELFTLSATVGEVIGTQRFFSAAHMKS